MEKKIYFYKPLFGSIIEKALKTVKVVKTGLVPSSLATYELIILNKLV